MVFPYPIGAQTITNVMDTTNIIIWNKIILANVLLMDLLIKHSNLHICVNDIQPRMKLSYRLTNNPYLGTANPSYELIYRNNLKQYP